MPNVTNITPPRVPLTDPATGIITREWFRFFLNLFTIAGSGSSDISVTDLAKAPTSGTAEVVDQINKLYAEALSAPRNELGTLAPLNQDNVPWLRFNTGALGYTPPVGTVFWDGGTTLTIQNTANVSQPVGEAQYFYIKATATITKGQVIMFDGSVGASGQLKGKPATGVTDGQYIMGIAAENIANNGFGIVTSFGLVRGFNTTGGAEAWTDGTILYYDPAVVGGLTKTVPSAPNVKVVMAAVVYASSGGAGSVFVRVGAGSKLGETDSNVQFTALADGNIIQYYATGGYWRNVAPSATLGAPVTKTADFSVGVNENWIIVNKSSTCTVTLPAAASYSGRVINIKTIQDQSVVSASANVVPLANSSAGTAILSAMAGQWATLVSDGTNWVIMSALADKLVYSR